MDWIKIRKLKRELELKRIAVGARIGGERLVFPLTYGRPELGDIVTKAAPDDVPIQPGDKHLFKIHPGQVPAWEKGVREQRHSQATKLWTELEQVSYGDGTGYFAGHPYPPPGKRQSARLPNFLYRDGPQP